MNHLTHWGLLTHITFSGQFGAKPFTNSLLIYWQLDSRSNFQSMLNQNTGLFFKEPHLEMSDNCAHFVDAAMHWEGILPKALSRHIGGCIFFHLYSHEIVLSDKSPNSYFYLYHSLVKIPAKWFCVIHFQYIMFLDSVFQIMKAYRTMSQILSQWTW